MKRHLVFLLLFNLILVGGAYAGDEAPGWLAQAATVKPPTYEKTVSAVVVRKEQQVTYGSDGKLQIVKNHAVRILNKDGRDNAVAIAFYLVSSSKVRDFNAWLIRPDGSVKKYEKNAIVDRISDPDDIYDEGRVKIIDASSDADAGSVFGYSVTMEERPLFNQDRWSFQGDLPVLQSSYSLSLPAGWKANSVTYNNAPIQPRINGSTYVWELNSLPPITYEPASPSFINISPFLMVNYFPENTSTPSAGTFANWTEVSKWLSSKHDAQVIIDDRVAGKARELTMNAKTEFERIHAIGNFVQNLQYISIDIGVGYGNGLIPRSSALVLQRGYGDCKDKANLMRAMLKTLGIESYPVALYSGDPTYVREEWASTGQFNHCIIAVKVSDATQSPTIITHAQLGRLLIFDATDPFTPVGDFPESQQGSLALIIAGEKGSLTRMPITPPDANKLSRQTELTLDALGNLKGTIRERSVGQAARSERAYRREMSPADYNKMIESWIVRGISTARLSKITPNDKMADGQFELDVELAAPQYAQLMQGRLMVFKPAVVSRNALFLTEPKRNYPVILNPYAFTESSVINLPADFTVDELPDAVNLDTPFGKYSTSYTVKDGALHFTRSMVINQAQIPVDKYNAVKDFFIKVRNAEQSPVVLLKK